jgi:hypothetical protein
MKYFERKKSQLKKVQGLTQMKLKYRQKNSYVTFSYYPCLLKIQLF